MLKFAANGITLYNGDAIELLDSLEYGSVEACLTDPPYPKKFAHLYWDIAKSLARVLRRGGSYMAIVPQYNLPTITAEVGKHLKWRWLHTMWQEDGSHPRMAMGIEVMHKPIGWWVKEAWPCGRGFRKDGFRNLPPSKENHEWEQSLAWADFCLHFVYDGGPVIDPLLGGGTMAIACLERNIPFIGVELDPEAFEVSVMRCEDYLRGVPVCELGNRWKVKAKR